MVDLLDRSVDYFAPRVPRLTDSITEIEIIPENAAAKKAFQPKKQPDRQVVREVQVPKSELKEDDTDLARFLSADRQRVRKEMQASQSGMTKNREQGSADKIREQEQKKSLADRTQNERFETAKDYSPDGVDIAKNLQEYARTMDPAPSTVGEALPQDVSIGSFTALNTDRYVYYSFYSRIEDMIRFRWESRVRQAVDSFDRNYILSVVGQKNWVTSLDIWLNKDGRFHSAHILKESGIAKFDQAAALAFKEAGMFSNPPAEMIEDDGYIHLRYNFNVRFRPSAVVFQN